MVSMPPAPCDADPTVPVPYPSFDLRLENSKASDVFLPLYVPLEEFLCGAIRHVKVNAEELRKAGHILLQDTFEVLVPKGAPDGHRVTFQRKVRGGDVIFVLQELAHPTWKRHGCHLLLEKTISVTQALTGSKIVIEHLDGKRLVVECPGEMWDLRPVEEAEWLRFDDFDAFAGQDAALLKTGDLDACKDVCRRNGWSGFTYFENRAYFRAQDRSALLETKKRSPGSILFVAPGNTQKLQRCILNAGMPELSRPTRRGHLFVTWRIETKKTLDEATKKVLRQVLEVPPQAIEEDLEEFELCDIDIKESLRQHEIIRGPESPPEDDQVSPCPPM